MGVNLLIFGAGYSGLAIARALRGEAEMAGTTRSRERFFELEAAGLEPFTFDGTVSEALAGRLENVTHLVQSIAPSREARPGERCVDPLLASLGLAALGLAAHPLDMLPRLEWIGYLSTVGVYGDHGGAWVDETTEPRPTSVRSKRRVAAEGEWRAAADARAVPLAILRLSGIYGPGRNAFVAAREGRARRLVKPGQVFNRIHRDDIGAAVRLAALARHDGILNVTDDEPAPPQDVVAFAHDLMGREPPPEQPFATADLSPMARSFYGENKRVGNARSKALGMTYRYPSYRAALRAMWPDGWR